MVLHLCEDSLSPVIGLVKSLYRPTAARTRGYRSGARSVAARDAPGLSLWCGTD